MTNQFEELLHELGKIFHLELRIDHSHACSIQMHDSLTIQLQLDVSQENLWIFSRIIEVPPGKFRENIFREALKANALPDPRTAHFGYLSNTNHLALFQKYPLTILNGERLAGLVGAFVEMADSWMQAIAKGQPAPTQLGPK
ncbi:MAG TPA: CesT family type III secretion system chaperone [Chlamydiales bacterium]|nr:CesT family type III secretion system chaperone [Chlamydiales bacterium]